MRFGFSPSVWRAAPVVERRVRHALFQGDGCGRAFLRDVRSLGGAYTRLEASKGSHRSPLDAKYGGPGDRAYPWARRPGRRWPPTGVEVLKVRNEPPW